MDCDGWQRVACALEEIAQNTASAGPSPFEIWASLVIPAVAALGSLLVALAAVIIARQSHTFAKQSRERDEAAQHRVARERLAVVFRSQCMAAYAQSCGLTMPGGVNLVLEGFQLKEECAASDEPYAPDLHDEFLWIKKWFLKPGEAHADEVGSIVQTFALLSVRTWVQDPEGWHNATPEREAGGIQVVNEARKHFGLTPLSPSR